MKKKRNELCSNIKFPDGSLANANLNFLFESADILAFHYGIGSCKSFTEYVQMVNEEDPIVISGLLSAASKRMRIMYGNEKYVEPDNTNIGFEKSNENAFKNEKGELINFLSFMGASKDELNDAIAKIDSRQIKTPERDYSWITPKELEKPGFDLKTVMAQMSEDIKNCSNIKVNASTRMSRQNG